MLELHLRISAPLSRRERQNEDNSFEQESVTLQVVQDKERTKSKHTLPFLLDPIGLAIGPPTIETSR
jgi:hypothetical protein